MWLLADQENNGIKAEFHYVCIDHTRIYGFLDQISSMGLLIPVSFLKWLSDVIYFLNFLNLTFRIEAGFITGGSVVTS